MTQAVRSADPKDVELPVAILRWKRLLSDTNILIDEYHESLLVLRQVPFAARYASIVAWWDFMHPANRLSSDLLRARAPSGS